MQCIYLHWESLGDNIELTIMDDYARIAKMFTHMGSGEHQYIISARRYVS